MTSIECLYRAQGGSPLVSSKIISLRKEEKKEEKKRKRKTTSEDTYLLPMFKVRSELVGLWFSSLPPNKNKTFPIITT
jgi:hypothetical protein